MTSTDHSRRILDTLAFARQVANYAEALGVSNIVGSYRGASNHLGAVLADCVLQAGLNYRTVVKARIERIIYLFPEATTLAGTTELVERGAVSDFLMWKHSEKIERFIRLVISDKLRRMLLLGIWHLPEGVSFARRSHHNIGLGSGRSPCECHNRRQIEATRARTSKR
jgi:hypothetical protein